MFAPRWEALTDPMIWIWAMGQAFFSLSVTGSGMIVYGAYLSKDEDVVDVAQHTALFDTIAAVVAALVIIPACFSYGLDVGAGPSLLFVTLPTILQDIPLGRLFAIILYVAMIFAGVSSLQNMFEAVAESLMHKFPRLSRTAVLVILCVVCLGFGIGMETIDKWGPWMDLVSIYIIPIGATLGAISWFYVMKKDELLDAVNTGSGKLRGNLWYSVGRYVYVPLAVILCCVALLLQPDFFDELRGAPIRFVWELPFCRYRALLSADHHADVAVEQDADKAAEEEVRGIVEIEKIFHAPARAACAVVAFEQRNGQPGEELKYTVDGVDEERVDQRVHRDPEHHARHLAAEVAAVLPDLQNGKNRDAAPVAREGEERKGDHGKRLLPLLELGPLHRVEADDAEKERPHHAGLVEYAGFERDKGDAEGKIVGEVPDDGKEQQPSGVLFQIAGVVVALGHHEPEDRRGHAPDDVQQQYPPVPRIIRPDHTGEVVDRHGKHGEELELIAAQPFIGLFHSLSFAGIAASQ